MTPEDIPEGPGNIEDLEGKPRLKPKFTVTDKRGGGEGYTPPLKTPKLDSEEEPPIPPPPDYAKINLEMQGDRMLIQNFPHAKKIGHIYTPAMLELEIDKGRVVGVGQDVKRVKVGDVIFKVAGLGQMLIDNQGNEYIFLPENAAIAIDRDFQNKPAEPLLPGNPGMPSKTTL